MPLKKTKVKPSIRQATLNKTYIVANSAVLILTCHREGLLTLHLGPTCDFGPQSFSSKAQFKLQFVPWRFLAIHYSWSPDLTRP